MSTSKRTPRSYVPKPRSGEDLVLLPLDPDEVIGEEKPRSRKTDATLAALTLVCVVMLAAYLGWNAASPQKSASTEEGGNAVQLRRAKEMIARLSALISRGDFATAVNSAITFRDNNPGLAKAGGNAYRDLLKLQRTATVKYFSSQVAAGRWPSYDTGDLDVAVIDHDLMTAYLQAAMPTFAREHFLNAEQGYDRVLSVARQRERTGAGGASTKRDIQQITENIGLLYTSWAEYKPDVSILRKADTAFVNSERLLDYAEDPVSARKRVVYGKTSIERVRRRLP